MLITDLTLRATPADPALYEVVTASGDVVAAAQPLMDAGRALVMLENGARRARRGWTPKDRVGLLEVLDILNLRPACR